MNEAEILASLANAERSLDEGGSLTGTGFWRAVEAVKGSPELVERVGARIAEIDERAFQEWPWIRLPIGVGTAIAIAVTVAGLGGIAAAYYLNEPWSWLVFGAATAVLIGSTHGLAHLAVGRALGMRFTHWFVASISQPQPGVKLNYRSYLRTPPRRRAWMHAAGALVTKLIPFLVIPAALAADLPGWVIWVLVTVGVATIITDVVWSTKASDWKRFRREMRHAASADIN
jgi:hypothetical protein